METVSQILKDARALIEDPKRWTQGAFARTATLLPIGPIQPKATCWCALGAITKVSKERTALGHRMSIAIECAIVELPDDFNSIDSFNDNTTHDKVLTLFDRAIARAERNQL